LNNLSRKKKNIAELFLRKAQKQFRNKSFFPDFESLSKAKILNIFHNNQSKMDPYQQHP